MRILVLNGASSATGAAFALLSGPAIASPGELTVIADGLIAGQGGAERLPLQLAEQFRIVGWPASSLTLIAVVVGPGSFTGLRATLALAHGLALGGSAAIVAVTVGEALGAALHVAAASIDGIAEIWCVSQARRDRVFIERPPAHSSGWAVQAVMLDALPRPAGPVLLGGDASAGVEAVLRAEGVAVHLSGLATPSALAIAQAALARRAGQLPPRDAQPLYVDPPEAKLPAAGPLATPPGQLHPVRQPKR